MKEPKIVAMLRLKNEERWIRMTLQALSKICSAIVVLDESTDKTLEICKSFDKVADIHEQKLPFDETRDKNTLLEMAKKQDPDYILYIDGDEVIHPSSRRTLFEELTVLYPEDNVFEFQSLFIWDKPSQYRYDGVYSNIWQRRLMRIYDQPKDLQYDGTEFPGNAHCPPIPNKTVGWDKPIRSNVKILHYGYYDESLRQRKFNFYTNLDPNNIAFDGYRHTISGEGKYSGPLGMEFRTIPKNMNIDDIS